MSNSTTAQRRKGGAPAKGSSTEVVHHSDAVIATTSSTSGSLVDADMNNNARMHNIPNGALLMVEDMIQKEQSSSVTTARATVRRNFCGTGPFDKHWLNVDCCGLFCAFLTYCLHVYGVYAVCFVLIPPWMSVIVNNNSINGDTEINSTTGEQQQYQQLLYHHSSHSPPPERYLTIAGQLNRFVFITMALLACVAHFKAMTTDPGAVPPDAKPLPTTPAAAAETSTHEQDAAAGNNDAEQQQVPKKPQQHLRLCRRCRAFKPARAHHCSVCKRCIIKMDHHCPWVNNCVGIGNHKYFLLFVFYTFLTCAYSLILIVVRFSSCVHIHRRNAHYYHAAAASSSHHAASAQVACLDQPAQLLTILGLLIESVLFGMFTSCMMFDQQEVVHNKMTHIDRLKGLEIGGSLEGIAEVFGVRLASSFSSSRNRRRRRDSDTTTCIPVPTLSPSNSNVSSSSSSSLSGVPAAKDQTRFRLDWLSPFVKACFPESVVDEVMGFCRPCRGGNNNINSGSGGGAMTELSSSKLAPGSKVVRSVTEIV